MRIEPTALEGLFTIAADPAEDARGAFARLYCPAEFAAAGIDFTPSQVNLSRNAVAGTLRGLHWQDPPHAEAKLVRCVAGRVWDVAVDLRAGSPTRLQWVGVELDAAAMNAVFIPEGFAHGFVTLTDGADVLYQMGRMFEPGHGRGARWDDPAFGIDWPMRPVVMSERDAGYPDFRG